MIISEATGESGGPRKNKGKGEYGKEQGEMS